MSDISNFRTIKVKSVNELMNLRGIQRNDNIINENKLNDIKEDISKKEIYRKRKEISLMIEYGIVTSIIVTYISFLISFNNK